MGKIETLALIFIALIPLAMPLIASGIAWRKITRPVMYFFISLLITFGASWVVLIILPLLFHESEVYSRSELVSAIAYSSQIILSAPFMYWLYRALRIKS